MKKALRFTAAALCLGLCLWFLLPLRIGTVHIGMLYPVALLLPCALAALLPGPVRRLFSGRLRPVAVAAAAVLGTATAAVLATCVLIGTAAHDGPQPGEEVTVLVLGCQVNGERSGMMLRGRIEAAADYLHSHPQAMCIATGGKGSGENISEAACIRRELIELGIDESRIYTEDRSVNTAENMAFSARIIQAEGLPTTVAVVSDNFHQLRASIFAARVGLEARTVGCKSPTFLAAGYWTREVLALAAAFIRGY